MDVWRWQQEFEIADACTQVQRAEAFQLRHRVFVEEYGWYPPRGDTEIDLYDFQSIHGLLYHRPTQRAIGTMRIITADIDSLLPAEQFLAQPPHANRGLFRNHLAELSRFAIIQEFRAYPRTLHPMLGLMAWYLKTSAYMGITYWYAVMEPRLAHTLLSMFGMHFEPLSPLVECHGTCRVYGRALREFVSDIKAKQPTVWEFLALQGIPYQFPEHA